MTKHPMAEVHVRLPVATLALADKMAKAAADPHKPDRGRWLTDLIGAEWARKERKANCPACDGDGYREGPACTGCGLSFECCPACDGSGAKKAAAKKGKARR